MRNKAKSLKNLPSTPPFTPIFLYVFLPLRSAGRQGMGVVVSSSHVVSTTPSSLHSFPVCGPFHGRQFSTNSPNRSPSHRLQFSMNSSSVGPSVAVAVPLGSQDFKMTGREFLELDSPQQRLILERFKRMEIIQKMFNELPKEDQNLCNHGKYFLAANSSLCGLAANNFFRSILHVRKASLVSAMPMAVIPFLSTAAIYEAFVHDPLFSGQLNCEVCAVIRGGLVGAVVGGFYPIFLAIPLNASLAARYMSAPLPGKENLLRYWLTTSQPVFRKMSVGILVQALTGLYLATKQHGIYIKMLLQMNSSRDPEELPE